MAEELKKARIGRHFEAIKHSPESQRKKLADYLELDKSIVKCQH